MSGLYLHTSNRLEALADALAEVLARPLTSPLTPETVTVQSKGMERWLSLQLAERRGIWANYRFPFPNALIRELIGRVVGSSDENPRLQPEIIAWRLFSLLPVLLARPVFAPLAPYLAAAPADPLRRWQLCRRIADVFDQYLVYRHDLIRTWERGGLAGLGPHEAWQAELWRHLAPVESPPHRARLVETFATRIAQGPLLAGCRLPERITLFGVTTLPPLHLEVLAAVAPFCDIHLFLLNPCRGYWFELKTPLEEARTLRRAEQQGIAADELWLADGHPLLASLGKSGRDLFRRLFDCELTSREHFVATAGTTLLGRLQNEILDGEHWAPSKGAPLSVEDRSLTLHACHGPLREVEALHDLLTHTFRELDDLAPREVLVMAPDIEVYAPMIEAVFSAESDGKRLIPFAISDRGTATSSPAQQALERFCTLPESRHGVAELLDLLELAPVARRFAMIDNDLATVRDWVETLHIHWGLDAADRGASGAPAEERFTWRAGLDRLLLGLALPAGTELFGGLLPAAGAEAGGALLGRLCDFIEMLGQWCDDCRRLAPATEWAERLRRLLDETLDFGGEQQDALRLHNACSALAAEARLAPCDEPLAFAVVRSRLLELLGDSSSHGFLSGPVTFCTLQPMRSVPFRVVALIGLNDGDFPRQGRSSGFDLMSHDRRLCDPQRRDEDRYLFLEALLSARERLIVTWQGNDPRDGSARPPAVVVGELIDAVCAGVSPDRRDALRSQLVIHHPLQPFSPAAFLAASRAPGASAHWYDAVLAARHRAESPPFCSTALPLPDDFPDVVALRDLERFWRQPCAYFLKNRLRLRLTEADEGVEEREPFRLDGLKTYQLGEDLTRQLLAGAPLAMRQPLVAAAGELPAGPMGEGAWRALAAEAQAFAVRLRPLLATDGECTAFTLQFERWQLVGELAPPAPQGRIIWRFARLRGRDRLGAWFAHLCACATGSAVPTVLVGRDETLGYVVLDAATARDQLATLLDGFVAGQCRPIPFFPESGLAYVTALRKGKGEDEARGAARKVWLGSEFVRGENEDRHTRLCFPSDPLDDAFIGWARSVWEPLLSAIALPPLDTGDQTH